MKLNVVPSGKTRAKKLEYFIWEEIKRQDKQQCLCYSSDKLGDRYWIEGSYSLSTLAKKIISALEEK